MSSGAGYCTEFRWDRPVQGGYIQQARRQSDSREGGGTSWGKTHHIRAQMNACIIAKLFGRADTRIAAKRYAHHADKTLADAVAKLPSFGGQAPSNVSTIC